jgi:hypothetical protein
MGPHWHDWLASHRAPGFVPTGSIRFVEVADTPELPPKRVQRRDRTRRAARGAARARGMHA